MVQLTNENFDQEVAGGVVLIDFYADWCGPCRALAPVLEQLQGAKIGKVNVDNDQELARQFEVYSIPKIVVLRDGVKVSECVGIQSQQTLQNMIDEALAGE